MKYIEPKLECILFDAEDIIATSSTPNESTSGLFPIDPDEGIII